MIVASDGVLVGLDGSPIKPSKRPTRDEKQRFYCELLTRAEERDYKIGWVSNKYRAKFGVWPDPTFDKTPMPISRDTKKWLVAQAKEYAASLATK